MYVRPIPVGSWPGLLHDTRHRGFVDLQRLMATKAARVFPISPIRLLVEPPDEPLEEGKTKLTETCHHR